MNHLAAWHNVNKHNVTLERPSDSCLTQRQGGVAVANVFAGDAHQGELELFAQLNSIVTVL